MRSPCSTAPAHDRNDHLPRQRRQRRQPGHDPDRDDAGAELLRRGCRPGDESGDPVGRRQGLLGRHHRLRVVGQLHRRQRRVSAPFNASGGGLTSGRAAERRLTSPDHRPCSMPATTPTIPRPTSLRATTPTPRTTPACSGHASGANCGNGTLRGSSSATTRCHPPAMPILDATCTSSDRRAAIRSRSSSAGNRRLYSGATNGTHRPTFDRCLVNAFARPVTYQHQNSGRQSGRSGKRNRRRNLARAMPSRPVLDNRR